MSLVAGIEIVLQNSWILLDERIFQISIQFSY